MLFILPSENKWGSLDVEQTLDKWCKDHLGLYWPQPHPKQNQWHFNQQRTWMICCVQQHDHTPTQAPLTHWWGWFLSAQLKWANGASGGRRDGCRMDTMLSDRLAAKGATTAESQQGQPAPDAGDGTGVSGWRKCLWALRGENYLLVSI